MSVANNLVQIGRALHDHHGMLRHFPSGGWGWDWVGVPFRQGPKQPGGWLFSVLPYIEQDNLYKLGAGTGPQTQAGMIEMLSTPVATFNCPARRSGGPYASTRLYYYMGDSQGNTYQIQPSSVARSDYAGNAGSQLMNQWGGGPASLVQGDDPSYPWPNWSAYNGIFYVHSSIAIEWISRGSSNTILAGERYLNPASYTGGDLGDNENQYTGFDNDVNRTTYYPPLRDTWGYRDGTRFGSAHPDGLNILYADGSVRFIDYGIDPDVFLLSGERD